LRGCGTVLAAFLTYFYISREAVMTINERKTGDVTVLDVDGKILLGEGDVQLKRKIDELIERKETKLVLNLANVPYMDSGGLGEIVRSYTTVKRAGGELKLLNATKRISDLLTITKLITVFEVFETEADAVKSFA
jgi:anti-sigma B factor antagonist